MKLSKSERDQHLLTIAEDTNTERREHAWFRLCADHFFHLRKRLDHVGNIPYNDALMADALDPRGVNTPLYFHHYDSDWLRMLKGRVDGAEKGLRYLRQLIEKEEEERKRNIVRIMRGEER